MGMGGVDTELIRTVTMSYILKQTHKLPKSPANILPQKTKYDEECWDLPKPNLPYMERHGHKMNNKCIRIIEKILNIFKYKNN